MKASRSGLLLLGFSFAMMAMVFVVLPSRFNSIATSTTASMPRPLSVDDNTPCLSSLAEEYHSEGLQTPDTSDVSVPEPAPGDDKTVEDLLQRLVTVTAISDNHFMESRDMLSSVKRCLPNNKIILYDLGLNDGNKRKIKEVYKDIEMRRFRFDDYKHLPHVRNLHTYAWKPILIKEVSLEYDAIMYGDASIRMISCDIKKVLYRLLNFPFVAAHTSLFKAIEFAHDGMMEYLHYPKARKDIAHMRSMAATGWVLWANATMKEKLIEPWLDCALHQKCIAPRGAKLRPCIFTKNHNGHFIGCHRYDQAALDLILAREFGPVVPIIAQNDSLSKSIWVIRRMK